MNELSKNVKTISTKRFKKYLINKFSVLNIEKYSPSRIFQNYLVFTPAKNLLNILVALLGLNRGKLIKFQKNTMKI